MPLSESDLLIVRTIADSGEVRSALERFGPTPADLWPLAEAYILFLRYAPTAGAVPPPSVWAMAQAHRESGPDYLDFKARHPDLDLVVQATLDRTKHFFTGTYRKTRDACLRGQPNLDPKIWLDSPVAIVGPEVQPWWLLAAMLGVSIPLGCIVSLTSGPTAVTLLAVATVAIFAAMAWFFVHASRKAQAELPITDDVVRKSLVKALPAPSRDKAIGRRADGDAAGEVVVGALGIGVAIASLFDW